MASRWVLWLSQLTASSFQAAVQRRETQMELAVSLSWGQNSSFGESKSVRICGAEYNKEEDFREGWKICRGFCLSLQMSNDQSTCIMQFQGWGQEPLERGRWTNPPGTRLGMALVLSPRGERLLYTQAKNRIFRRVLTQYWCQINLWLKAILDLPKNS